MGKERFKDLERYRQKLPPGLAFLLEMVELYFEKRVSRSAAELAYFLILSFFPALICINAVIGLFHMDVNALLDQAALIIPADAVGVLRDYVGYITINQSRTLLAAGAVMMIFSASAAMRSLMNIMDDIYEHKSYTGLWQVVASVAFSVLFLLIIYLSFAVMLTGSWFFHLLERILRKIPALAELTLPWQWQWIRFLVLFCIVFFFVLLLYLATAPRTQVRPPVFTGALLASGALVLCSWLFSYFIDYSSRYSLVYGSLASLIIMLVWLYLCGNIVILGNCFNRVWYGHKWSRFRRRMEVKEEANEKRG